MALAGQSCQGGSVLKLQPTSGSGSGVSDFPDTFGVLSCTARAQRHPRSTLAVR